MTAVKVYSPQDGTISVHASRVTRYPLHFLQEATGVVVDGVDRDVLHEGWISWSKMKPKQTRQAWRPEGLIQKEGTNSETEESPSDEEWMFMDRGDDLEDGLPEIDTELPKIKAEAERPSPLSATSAGTRRLDPTHKTLGGPPPPTADVPLQTSTTAKRVKPCNHPLCLTSPKPFLLHHPF